MNLVNSVAELKTALKSLQSPGGQVGFVPTMGALHAGHAELLKISKKENSISILSIFVNPTQFNSAQDLITYPKTLDADLKIAKVAGVDIVWTPSYQELYPDAYAYKITESIDSKDLCGASRPGHFDGVLSVVMKLLQATGCQRAYFGEKDFQQLTLIKGMAKAFFLDCEILGVPTIREKDGLALSSRNLRLTQDQRNLAPLLYETLISAKSSDQAIIKLNSLGFNVDYVVDKAGRRYAAVFLDQVRLIDNVKI